MKDNKIPSPLVSLLPVFVLILLLFVTIRTFGSDALSGGSQVCLLVATAVCVLIGMAGFRRPWKDFELAVTNNIAGVRYRTYYLADHRSFVRSMDGQRCSPYINILWHTGYSSSFFPGIHLHYLCGSICHDRQLMDYHRHYRHRTDGNREGARFQ